MGIESSDPLADDRDDGVILGDPNLASSVAEFVRPRVRRLVGLAWEPGSHPLHTVSRALALGQTSRVLLVPAQAEALDDDALDTLLTAYAPYGAVATDGIRDMLFLSVLPRSRAAEAAAAARRGASVSLFTANLTRVRLADASLVGVPLAAR